MSKMNLKKFEKNIQSQFGEDGIIEEIFNRIGTSNKVCVEFGAWDGVHLSNAWNLWYNKSWHAVLIEADEEKFYELSQNIEHHQYVKAIHALVEAHGENSLDNIFERLMLPHDLDLLSIDVDGNDFYIFESLEKYSPRLILIEFNPTIPPHLEVVQEEDEYFGASALALLNLAHRKGYRLAHVTDVNLCFVKESEFHKLNIQELTVQELFPYQHLTYIITAFDGMPYLSRTPVFSQGIQKRKRGKVLSGYEVKKVESSAKHHKLKVKDSLEPVLIYKTE